MLNVTTDQCEKAKSGPTVSGLEQETLTRIENCYALAYGCKAKLTGDAPQPEARPEPEGSGIIGLTHLLNERLGNLEAILNQVNDIL